MPHSPSTDSKPETRNPSPEQNFKDEILGASPVRGRNKAIWVSGLLILLLAIGLWLAWEYSTQERTQYRYDLEQVTKGDLTIQVTATGTLNPLDQVDISSETSGTVKAVLVDENDQVKQGQVLLKLDTTTLEAQVEQARANVNAAQAQLKQAQVQHDEAHTTFQRKAELEPKEFISKEEVNTARSAFRQAQANLESAQAQLEQMQATLALQQDKLRKAIIVSPLDGVVLSRKIDPGQTVAASLQAPVLFTLARTLTQMELLLNIDEADIGQVKEGQTATFTVDAFPEETFPATITKVHLASETVDGVVTYPARLKVDNPELKLKPGMTSTADITVAHIHNALLVPNSALRFELPKASKSGSSSVVSQLLPRRPREEKTAHSNQKADHVWVLENGVPKQISVQTGLTDGLHTEITSGLELGQAVIIDTLEGRTP
ncbi:efflux RND transporter periplasmic adaptor subunit [Thiomicrorhabdus sp. zzn3]|uniref:efflux RND transporter periplasmic adaptor subunit n=1 Tax=Thiomicrorhabdus sp. zzn3 TaxID=3039775 RepID=UPI0024370E71|nr:efflux RND transporter periplasmic adaptor subunit [Thiomicrorhabdus sp. zzn3]MDG6777728.1 efflux RND transporter periplasmic adaptor subunit [Thiomicrorhabdus sp. zzn3]